MKPEQPRKLVLIGEITLATGLTYEQAGRVSTRVQELYDNEWIVTSTLTPEKDGWSVHIKHARTVEQFLKNPDNFTLELEETP